MQVESSSGTSLQKVYENRLLKNQLKSKYKISRPEYNRQRRHFMQNNEFQQQYAAKSRPEIVSLVTSTIREEHQRLVKQHKNSVSAYESLNSNHKSIRLKHAELEQRIRVLPLQIQGLEDLRDLWRALQNYATDLNQTSKMVYLIEKEKKNIVEAVYAMVPSNNQLKIDLFLQCFKTPDLILKWKTLVGTPKKWQSFFTT